jgi:hypothetical protein
MAQSWEQILEVARGNETKDQYNLEHKCGPTAKWSGRDEHDWKSLIDLITYIEASS